MLIWSLSRFSFQYNPLQSKQAPIFIHFNNINHYSSIHPIKSEFTCLKPVIYFNKGHFPVFICHNPSSFTSLLNFRVKNIDTQHSKHIENLSEIILKRSRVIEDEDKENLYITVAKRLFKDFTFLI